MEKGFMLNSEMAFSINLLGKKVLFEDQQNKSTQVLTRFP